MFSANLCHCCWEDSVAREGGGKGTTSTTTTFFPFPVSITHFFPFFSCESEVRAEEKNRKTGGGKGEGGGHK